MSPSRLAAAIGGWKTGAGVVGGVFTAAVVCLGIVQQPIKANTNMAKENRASVEALSARVSSQEEILLRILCNQNPEKSWNRCDEESAQRIAAGQSRNDQ